MTDEGDYIILLFFLNLIGLPVEYDNLIRPKITQNLVIIFAFFVDLCHVPVFLLKCFFFESKFANKTARNESMIFCLTGSVDESAKAKIANSANYLFLFRNGKRSRCK